MVTVLEYLINNLRSDKSKNKFNTLLSIVQSENCQIVALMDSIQLILNDQLVTITADPPTVKRMNEDDHYLAEYVNRAAKAGQFHFLFIKDPTLRRIVVKRVPATFIPVWSKKGRPSESDTAATILLLKLRNSSKYAPRFRDGYSLKNKLWEEIASEMRIAGFDVDGNKCAQKFIQLTQYYQKTDCQCYESSPEMCAELKKVFGEKKGESEEDDEEWLPKSKRRRRDEDEGDFLKKFLKKSSEKKEERFKEMCALIRRRNEILEEKLKLSREMIGILGKIVQQ